MAKLTAAQIQKKVQALYNPKDKSRDIISTGDMIKAEYTEKDGVLLKENHPFRELLGIPVLPFNKILQVVGKPDTGKSTWSGEIMIAAQKQDFFTILFDSEDKFDTNRFKDMGGNSSEVLLARTNEILKGGELVRRYINTIKESDKNAKILFVWDSVGGSQSRSHAERELDNEKHAQPGQDAKENGSIMKMLVALINKYPDSIAILLVNQSYAKIGFMQKGEAAAGGSKIEYHSSFIVALKRIKVLTKVIKGTVSKFGIISRATVTKNHLSKNKISTHQIDFQVTSEGSSLVEMAEIEDNE